ncbi:MAG: CPBP family intramembrane glutamic endopeptidase [Anaerolineae bacterium]|jgi:membrane protease YdiL (CAAX protease family)|nr:CPBP family intramembrane glutamic endopeptidase [Anaerolineae bacterium]
MTESQSTSRSVLTFLLICYGFTWVVWLPGVLSSYGILPNLPWPPFFGIGTFGPMVSAVWILKKEGGWAKVKEWLNTGFRKKVGWRWWVILITVSLLTPPLGLWLFSLTGGEIAEISFFRTPWMIIPTFLLMLVMGGGNEEFGWRGFLLPRLLERFTPLQADLILIPLHAFWHIPLFFNASTIQYTYPFWLFTIFGIGFTPLINRIYRNTSGSILAAIFFHAFVNTSLDLFPPVGPWVGDSPIPLVIIGVLFLFFAIIISLSTKEFKTR